MSSVPQGVDAPRKYHKLTDPGQSVDSLSLYVAHHSTTERLELSGWSKFREDTRECYLTTLRLQGNKHSGSSGRHFACAAGPPAFFIGFKKLESAHVFFRLLKAAAK